MNTRQSLIRLVVCLGLMLSLAGPVAAATPRAPSATCTVDGSGGADYATIQDAVDDATCDTITVAAGEYEENVVIARSLTLTGAGADETWAGGTGQVFLIDNTSAVVAISGVTIQGIYHSGNGTGVYNEGKLTLDDVFITDNQAGNNGGGIYNTGSLTLTNSIVEGGWASDGGGIYNAYGDTLIIVNSIIRENTAWGDGGGIFSYGALVIENSQVVSNTATGSGGGLYGDTYSSYPASITITGSEISGNTADADGGGVYSGSAAVITGGSVNGNTAEYGGGIYNDHYLLLNNGTVSTNIAGSDGGGLFVSAPTTLTNAIIGDNQADQDGGGIYGESSLNLENSYIHDNTAHYSNGGGIHTYDDLQIAGSTVSGNAAQSSGGGIWAYAAVTLTNVTVSGNSTESSGGGMYVSGYDASTLDSVTITDNTADSDGDNAGDGGGLNGPASGVMIVKNTLIAGNHDDSPTDVSPDCFTFGSFTSQGYNLIGNNSGCTGFVLVTDKVGTSSSLLDPRLTALGDYGGPTPVHALRYGRVIKSPAVDTGAPDCPAVDQRGVLRPLDGDENGVATCDIGAFELSPDGLTDVRIIKGVTPGIAAPGDAIYFLLAFSNEGVLAATGVRITDTFPSAVTVVSVTSDVVITQVVGTQFVWEVPDLEPGAQGFIEISGMLSDDLAGGVFTNTATIAADRDDDPGDNSSSVSITVAPCYATPDDGVTVYQSADAQAVRDAINAASVGGVVKVAGTCAGVDSYGRVVPISRDITLRGGYTKDQWNIADPGNPATLDAQDGGRVVYVTSSDATLMNLRITGGATNSSGGGIYAGSSAVVLHEVSVFDNSADNYGGGIYVGQGSLVLHETDVFSNTADDYGGGVCIFENDTVLSVSDGHIYANSAGQSGGGIYFTGSGAALTQTHIFSNTTPGYGGGVYVYSTTVTMSHGLIFNNTGKYGGGMYISSGDATLNATHISNNTATYGGAIYARDVTLTANAALILSNTATTNGGGVYVYSGHATLERSAVVYNTAQYGGGVYNTLGMLALMNVTLGQNAATQSGGGLFANDGSTTVLTFTTIVDNQAAIGGGIYHTTDASVAAQNSLLGSNSLYNCDSAVVSNGYNLEDNDTCGFTATGDQQNTAPLLAALAENGGDTLTYALQPGSPAIDAGTCAPGITTDQRGAPRPGPGSAACDVGAYESDIPAPPDVIIAKTVTPSGAAPGDPITYTLAFTNTSSVTATGVVITDIIPVEIDLVGYENLSGLPVTREPGTWYVWHVQNLNPGMGGVIVVTGTLRLPLAAGIFTNTAEITARRDADAGNNNSTVQATVLNAAPAANDATLPPVNEDLSLNALFSASDNNGDALTYAVLMNPISGTVALTGANHFIYTPTNQTASYTDTFTYIVADTGELTDTAIIAIPVTANDDPPFISDIPNQRTDSGVTVGPLPFTVDDTDTPVDTLTLGKATSNPALTPPANITFSGSGANRTVTVTPTMGTGTALITVTVNDGHSSRRDVFALTVGAAVNSPPEFTSAPVTEATQDVVYTYTVAAADLDAGDTLTIVATLKPGWLILTDHGDGTATLTGTPRNADVGDHSVTLRVVDSAGATEVQDFVITVANVNDAPIARNDFASTGEHMPKVLPALGNDSDPDGNTPSLKTVSVPLYGSATISDTDIVYTPTNRLATYTDVLTYTITDGALDGSATISVTVSADDDPPTISNIPNRQTRQGVATGPITFTVNDPDTPLTALTLDKAASNTMLTPLDNITFGGSGNLRTVTITPTAALYGIAFITVTVGDAHASAADSFVLDVVPNNAPVFVTEPITEASEDLEYTYAILAVDADGDALNIIAPVHPIWLHFVDHGDGNAVLSGLPLASDVGEHPVTLRVVDSFGAPATQTFTVTVAAVNDAPLARNDIVATDEHPPRTIPVLANDSDPDSALFIAEVGTPLYGSAVISGDVVIYTPLNRVASYTDTFVYVASDGLLEDVATVVVDVTATDDPPFISNVRNQHTDAGAPLTIPFVVNDPDTPLDTLILDKASSDESLVSAANIAFDGSGMERTVTITPTAGLSGTAAITLTVNDGTSSAADGFMLAVAVNSPPEFISAPLTEAIEGTFYVYHIIAVDVETTVLTITAPVSPTWLTLYDYHNGRATLVGKPLQEDVGDHDVTLRVEDGAGGNDTQSFVITVHDVLHPPHAVNDDIATDEDTPVSVAVLGNDDDLDGDPLTLVAWGQPQSGIASCDTLLAMCSYTPANKLSDYTVAFTYTMSDGGLIDEAAVWVNVTADDDPPGITAIDDQHTDAGIPVGPVPFIVGDPDTPIPALLLDKTSSNTALVPVENITLGGEGVQRTVTVTPTMMSGAATITISVSDGASTAYEAFVLAVGANNPPEFTSAPKITATAGIPYTYTVTVDDADPGDVLTITAPTLPGWLNLTQSLSRTATLTGTSLSSGEYPVALDVTDGVDHATQTFTVTVGASPVNRPPVADAGPDQIVAASAVVILDGSASTDLDGDVLVYFWQQTGGQPVSLSHTGVVSPTFTTPSSAGALTFTLTITDTGGLADSDEVVINVTDYFVFLPLVVRNN